MEKNDVDLGLADTPDLQTLAAKLDEAERVEQEDRDRQYGEGHALGTLYVCMVGQQKGPRLSQVMAVALLAMPAAKSLSDEARQDALWQATRNRDLRSAEPARIAGFIAGVVDLLEKVEPYRQAKSAT